MYVFYSTSGVIVGDAHATDPFKKEQDKGQKVGENIEDLL